MMGTQPGTSYRIIDDRPAGAAPSTETIQAPEAAAPEKPTTRLQLPTDAALMVLTVPSDAAVFVNGSATTATGAIRHYVSRGLEAGKQYEFQVRIVVDRNGSSVEDTKLVSLSAGDRAAISFNSNRGETTADVESNPAVTTSLTLHVPESATVWLAGNETGSTGNVRLFETTALDAGRSWKNYEIRISTMIDGEETVVSKIIDLVAGGSIELTFDSMKLNSETSIASHNAAVSLR